MQGIFSIDFDELSRAEAARAQEERQRRYTEAELDAAVAEARAAAFAEGRAAGHAEGTSEAEGRIAARSAAALEAMAPQIEAALADAAAHRAALQRDLLDFTLGVCEKFLPAAGRAVGTAQVKDQIAGLIAQALPGTTLVIRLSPRCAQNLGPDLEALHRNQGDAHIEIREDDTLEDTQTHVAWQNGSLSYSYRDVCAGILAALRAR